MARILILRLLENYFRHRWIYLLPIVFLSIAGGIYLYKAPRLYTTYSTVYVQKQSMISALTAVNNAGFSWSTPSQLATAEFRELIQTDSFIRAVIQKTDLESTMNLGSTDVENMLKEVRKSVWVAPVGDNQIAIGANYKNPQVAVQLVQGLFDIYLSWKINSANTDAQVAQNFFSSLIPTYKGNLESIRQELLDYLIQHPEPIRGIRPDTEQVQVDRIQGDLQIAGSRYVEALNKLENAKLAASQNESDIRQTYTMIDAPELPTKPATSLRSMALKSLIFVVVGVLISTMAVLGISVLDRSFRFPIDVQSRIGLPVLAMIPDTTSKHFLITSQKHGVKKSGKKRFWGRKAKKSGIGKGMSEQEIIVVEADAENV
jgi:uncharacterized protein involved in exopolysaccharide biosynthesis